MDYPLRPTGVAIGDVVYWTAEDDMGTPIVVESKIVAIQDAYYFAPRTPEDNQENFAIFYDIAHYRPHSLVYGVDLFYTRDEAQSNV